MTGGPLRATAHIALGVAGFLLGASALRALVPKPDEFGLADKLDYLAAHGDVYDAVVLGTSASQFGVRPVVLDAELARLGHAQVSFNLAIAGLNAYELVQLADELLARRPARLSRVWLEVLPWQLPAGADRQAALFERDLWWRTTPRTLEVLAALGRSDAPADVIVRQGAFHLSRWLQHGVAFAQGPPVLAGGLGLETPRLFLDEAALVAEAGWMPLSEEQWPEASAARQRFLAHISDYGHQVRALDEANDSDEHDLSLDLPTLRALLARLDAAGCEVLLFVPPVDRSTAEAYRLCESGELPPVLGFNAPGRFPRLYRFDNRFDGVHLNAQGADEFSAALARAAAEGPLALTAQAAAGAGAR